MINKIKKMGKSIDRCPTGITGFDKLCGGGLVRNSINVILGGPGAGKSTLLLQFLYNGVNDYKEKGLYISFESEVEDIYEDAMTFGWDFKKLGENGKCKVVKLSPKSGIVDIREEIGKLVAKNDIKRVCIDPVSLLAMTVGSEGEVRELIFDLAAALKKLKVTILLANETIDNNSEHSVLGTSDVRATAMKFLADGVINLYSMGLGGATDRAIRIEKMRRTNHVRGPVPFEMDNKGITVSPR
jgi:circadian clock protein KaiC